MRKRRSRGAGFPENRTTYSAAPSEHVDPSSGAFIVSQVDLALPGNAGLDLVVQRVYSSSIFPNYNSGGSTAIEEDSWAGIGWTLHFGRVLNPNSTAPGETKIEMGDGSRHALHTTSAYPEGRMTKDFWRYNRTNHTLQMTNGTTYTFGRSVDLGGTLGDVRYVTSIAVFGNSLAFEYWEDPSGPKDALKKITQDLGNYQTREVTFTYDAALNSLATMHYLDRTWTHTHVAAGPTGHSILRFAQGPTTRPWEYG